MSNIKLLDCTLRDGGYINDWEFGHDNIVSIFERLVSAKIDIIEVGFLDDRRKFDINRTIAPNTQGVDEIFNGLDKGNAIIVGMIDYGTCAIENLSKCEDSFLDGIRVIFKKHIKEEAIAFCKQVKDLGYKVFTQAVSITSYSDKEMLELIDLVNDLEPYAVSIVDTYGLLHKNHLMHYFELLDHNLTPDIGVGYHSHNNFQLGYANCIEMLEAKTNRIVLVDGSLFGMGKCAGNTPLELLAMHLNDSYCKDYDVSQMLEAIDVNIMNEFSKQPWGYTMGYYVCAANDCHPNYVSYLRCKHTLSIKSINEILETITEEKKLMYDKDYIENLYIEYQKKDFNDEEAIKELTEALQGKKLLLIGPGKNVVNQKENIKQFIEKTSPIVITTNFKPIDYDVDYIFISNSKRYVQLATALSKLEERIKTIATSNVTKTNGKFDYTLEYSVLLDENAVVIDNSLIMLLKVIQKVGVKEVALAGFDGYSTAQENNYFNSNFEYSFECNQARDINEYVINSIKNMKEELKVEFITDSFYDIH